MVENKFPESVSLREGHLNPVLAPEGEILSATKNFPGFRPAGQPTAVQIRSRRICAWPKDQFAGSKLGRTQCARRVRDRKVAKQRIQRQICREQIWTPKAREARAPGWRESAGHRTSATCRAPQSCCTRKPWANLPWFARSPFGSPLALLACQAGSAEGASMPLYQRVASVRRPVGPIRLASCDAQRG